MLSTKIVAAFNNHSLGTVHDNRINLFRVHLQYTLWLPAWFFTRICREANFVCSLESPIQARFHLKNLATWENLHDTATDFVNRTDSIFFKLGFNQVLNYMHNVLPDGVRPMNQFQCSSVPTFWKLLQFMLWGVVAVWLNTVLFFINRGNKRVCQDLFGHWQTRPATKLLCQMSQGELKIK